MKALIIGGTGWVGHYIANEFAENGHDVTSCSRGKKKEFVQHLSDKIKSVAADKKTDEMGKVFKDYYDVVIDTRPSVKTIDKIREYSDKFGHYIHCSSTGGYAPLNQIPGDESMPYEGFRGGWMDKVKVDAHVMELYESEQFPATVIRPPYITGPGMIPLDNLGGRREDFLSDILEGKALDLPESGMALIQPVYVKDLANAFLLAAQNEKTKGQIYNICLEKAVTLNEYIQFNAKALGKEAIINYMSVDEMLQKYSDSIDEIGLQFMANHMCYDISKAKNELGYLPTKSTGEAVMETAQWSAQHLKLQGGNSG